MALALASLMLRTLLVSALLMLAAPSVVDAQAEPAGPHVSLFRTEGDARLAISLSPHRSRGRDAWSEPCALPCSLRVSGMWDLLLSEPEGDAHRRLQRPIDGYSGGEYVMQLEGHAAGRRLGYVGLVFGALSAGGTVVSALAMLIDTLAYAGHALVTAASGGTPEAHEEPWWILAPLGMTAIVLLILGAIGASDHDVAELRRVGPGPSGAFRRPQHARSHVVP